MKIGDEVLVYPHGDRDRAAAATVAILSSNGRSIAVGFPDKPPFSIGPGMAIHPDFGLVMFAMREALDGPWIELTAGGRYEIEERTQQGG